DRRLVSLRPRHGGARDRADQHGLLPPRRARSRSRSLRHSRRAPASLERDDALGDLVLYPLDAPRGPDEGRAEADEGGEGGGRERGPANRRRPTLLPPLRTDGGASYRVRQPGHGGASRGRSRGDRTLGARRARPRARGALPGDRGLAMEADPHRRQSHAASSRGGRPASEQARSLVAVAAQPDLPDRRRDAWW